MDGDTPPLRGQLLFHWLSPEIAEYHYPRHFWLQLVTSCVAAPLILKYEAAVKYHPGLYFRKYLKYFTVLKTDTVVFDLCKYLTRKQLLLYLATREEKEIQTLK